MTKRTKRWDETGILDITSSLLHITSLETANYISLVLQGRHSI